VNKQINKNELIWQIAFKNFINANNNDFVSQSGLNISILSIGEHNKFEGPDFKNACAKINENIIIGDIEFHKKSSDWINHNHSSNSNYNNVILHIILKEDKFFQNNFETILLNREMLEPYCEISNKNNKSKTTDILANEEYKYLSTLRILKKTKTAYNLLKTDSIDNVIFSMLTDFLMQYSNFRTRCFNKEIDLVRIFSLLKNSYLYNWLYKKNKYLLDVNELFKKFIEETNLGDVSKHLKQEIVTNVILPVALCFNSTATKTQLMLWYYSAKTRSKYGILNRIYPGLEQKYIWQQQGMLEHHKNNYNFHINIDYSGINKV